MKKSKISTLGLAIFALAQIATPVMAAAPYGMDYTGGEELGAGNVIEDPELIDGLTPLIATTNSDITFQGRWEDGYAGVPEYGVCEKVKYLTISKQNLFNVTDNYSYSIQKGQYEMGVRIKNVVGEYGENNDNTYMIGFGNINGINGMAHVGYRVYEDASCENRKAGIDWLYSTSDKLFVELEIKLYKEGQAEVFTSDELYFRFTDIDAGQSYKILNSADKLTANKMYTKSLSALLPTDPSITARNMFNATENYIYSEYIPSWFDATGDIYVHTSIVTQQEGLDIVFGFNQDASSAIEYYAKQYTVTYESDESGTITGITDEQVISGDTPSGSTEQPKENYELDYWEADKDVTLTDGTVIKAGEPITMEQIKKVVVNEDITFTAIHKTKVKVPDTGTFTKDINGMLVSLPVIGIMLGALILGLLPRLTHKKISFKK